MTAEPDPRTVADDDADATNRGQSAPDPAEGADDVAEPGDGSPEGGPDSFA